MCVFFLPILGNLCRLRKSAFSDYFGKMSQMQKFEERDGYGKVMGGKIASPWVISTPPKLRVLFVVRLCLHVTSMHVTAPGLQGNRRIKGRGIDSGVLKTHRLHTDPYDLIHVDPPTFPGATLPVPYNNLQLRKLDPKRRESRGK